MTRMLIRVVDQTKQSKETRLLSWATTSSKQSEISRDSGKCFLAMRSLLISNLISDIVQFIVQRAVSRECLTVPSSQRFRPSTLWATDFTSQLRLPEAHLKRRSWCPSTETYFSNERRVELSRSTSNFSDEQTPKPIWKTAIPASKLLQSVLA